MPAFPRHLGRGRRWHAGTPVPQRRQADALALKQAELITPDMVDAQGQGPSGHRPIESTPEQTDEATFAKLLAHRLNAAALKQAFEHLFLIADPTTMGEIRPQLHSDDQAGASRAS